MLHEEKDNAVSTALTYFQGRLVLTNVSHPAVCEALLEANTVHDLVARHMSIESKKRLTQHLQDACRPLECYQR